MAGIVSGGGGRRGGFSESGRAGNERSLGWTGHQVSIGCNSILGKRHTLGSCFRLEPHNVSTCIWALFHMLWEHLEA